MRVGRKSEQHLTPLHRFRRKIQYAARGRRKDIATRATPALGCIQKSNVSNVLRPKAKTRAKQRARPRVEARVTGAARLHWRPTALELPRLVSPDLRKIQMWYVSLSQKGSARRGFTEFFEECEPQKAYAVQNSQDSHRIQVQFCLFQA